METNFYPEKYITGKVLSVFFQNTSNFYKVILISVTHTENVPFDEKEIVVTGHFGQIQEDITYHFYGKLTEHPKYGLQFLAERYEEEKPKSEAALIDYFSSDKFPGIGKKTAQNIVEALGDRALDEITADPEKLEMVKGLNLKKRKMILSVLDQEKGSSKDVFFLQENGFSSAMSYKIIECFQEKTIELLKENPYRLIEEMKNIGFLRADNFAENLGIQSDAPERLKAALFFALHETCLSNGNTYEEKDPIIEKAIEVLEKSRPFLISKELLEQNLSEMIRESRIVQEDERYYLPSLLFAEKELAFTIEDMLNRQSENNPSFSDEDLSKRIKKLEKGLVINYGESQKEAIKLALRSPLFILTGGPGTGKTTVIEGIVNLFAEIHDLGLEEMDVHDENFPILLAAPTGRAAKRMKESTGFPSATIHRLLGLTGEDDEKEEFSDRTLKGKLLVVDEMSMVDTWLAAKLFKSIPDGMHVILVGDRDQLPSVGPGQVLHDLLASEQIPAMELKEIYRQEDDSSIIPLAHNIKNNQLPEDLTVHQKDRSFFGCRGNQVLDVVSKVVQKAIAKGFTPMDIQVLAPMYRGPAGIDNLNRHLQDIFNPNHGGRRKEIRFGDVIYRVGDKVLQLINDTENGVFNGDMGEITGIIPAKDSVEKVDELVVLFDQKEITYRRSDWKKITLAYCCSIHKAQGSEFKLVILPLVSYFGRMLRKDLLYTAVTRASEMLILCGEPQAFQRCISMGIEERKTTLESRIRGLIWTKNDLPSDKNSFEKKSDRWPEKEREQARESFLLTSKQIKEETISPMIGMEKVVLGHVEK